MRLYVRSECSDTADQINSLSYKYISEQDIHITAALPNILTTDAVQDSDVVITMGCGDVCPIFPGKRYEDWELADPAGQDLETVRRIRDDIKTRVQYLVAELLAPTDSTQN